MFIVTEYAAFNITVLSLNECILHLTFQDSIPSFECNVDPDQLASDASWSVSKLLDIYTMYLYKPFSF